MHDDEENKTNNKNRSKSDNRRSIVPHEKINSKTNDDVLQQTEEDKRKPRRTMPCSHVENIQTILKDHNDLEKDDSCLENENEDEKRVTLDESETPNGNNEPSNNDCGKSASRPSFSLSQEIEQDNRQRFNQLSHVINACGKDKVFNYVQKILNQGSNKQKKSLLSCFDDIDKQH